MKGAVWREEDRTPSSSSLVLSLEPAPSRVSDWRGSWGGEGVRTGQLHHTKTAGATSPVSWPGDLPRSAQAEALGNTD